ncbi:MAG: regulatory signaling modulator protein AmpE [Halothiobacillus sp.]|nr:regulatory signaling modulator protein AmpE [Halothiobacillus sp.]
MKLLILIVVMVLERFWTTLDDMRADRAIENQVLSIRDRLSKTLGAPLTLGLIWIVFPLLIAWLMSSLGSSPFGLIFYLLISIVVLLLLLAPRQINQQVTALHEACEHEDEAGAAHCRAKLAEGTSLDAETATTQQLAERIIALGFQEWFAVLFWFVVFGPAGAVFYRLSDWLARPTSTESGGMNLPGRVQAVLDWPVARLYAVLLLLAGGFNRGLDAWINGGDENEASLAQKNAALVGRVGHAALELEREDDCAEGEACLADQSRWYKNASALVLRALLIGLGFVAMLTLSGWLH